MSFRVVVAGGGVAALEAALALRDLADDRVETTLLAPGPEFVYRPMAVVEPFWRGAAQRHRLDMFAAETGVDWVADSFSRLDREQRMIHTESGRELGYDAVLLALGARRYERYQHTLTLDDSRLGEQLGGLLGEIKAGTVRKLAFVIPSRVPWPLPVYELALMTDSAARAAGADLSITITTPEDAPLALFGAVVSNKVASLLEQHAIHTITSARCEIREAGEISIHPGPRHLTVDRIVALPELFGPSVPGVPTDAEGGFISVDPHGRVRQLENVFAAGDATDFPVKFGGIAAQQADAAAEAIAALAGAGNDPQPFHPIIHGMLLGAEEPLYLSAHITGGHGSSSEISDTPSWSPAGKIAAKYLSPYLEEHGQLSARGTGAAA